VNYMNRRLDSGHGSNRIFAVDCDHAKGVSAMNRSKDDSSHGRRLRVEY
jgi:hypothetical protein